MARNRELKMCKILLSFRIAVDGEKDEIIKIGI